MKKDDQGIVFEPTLIKTICKALYIVCVITYYIWLIWYFFNLGNTDGLVVTMLIISAILAPAILMIPLYIPYALAVLVLNTDEIKENQEVHDVFIGELFAEEKKKKKEKENTQ